MKKVKSAFLVAAVLALFLTSCQGIVTPELTKNSDGARASSTASSSKRVVGYFCEWGIYGAHDNYYATSIPANKLTHINYAFVGLDPSTQAVQIFDPWATTDIVYPGDAWDTQYKGNLGQLRKLKEQYPHLKVLISVGGWTKSNGFHNAASTDATRARAAENLKNFVVQYGLDGVDIDWEYPGVNRDKDPNDQYDMGAPGGIEDKEKFTLFLKAIREALDAQGQRDGKKYELTAAIGVGYDKIAVTNPGEYSKYLDALNLMTYDMHGAFENNTGHQAPLYANMNCGIYSDEVREKYNIDWAVKKFIAEGVPANKIVVGLPFYSRGWNNVSGGLDFDGDGVADGMFGTGGSTLSGKWGVGGQSPYFEIKKLENTSGWVKYRDEVSKACWLYNRGARELYTYDDQETIKTKCDYINNLGLGGAMYWELDGDDWKNGYDLVNIVYDAILNGVDFGMNTNPGNNGGSSTGSNENSGNTQNPGTQNPVTTDLVSGATYKILAKCSGKSLDVADWSTSPSTNIHQWEYYNQANQHWILTQTSDGYWTIVSEWNGFSLDCEGWGTNSGTNVLQWYNNAQDNQKWAITPMGNGYYKVINKYSSLALDVNAASADNGANVQTWEWNGTDAQLWSFTKIDGTTVENNNNNSGNTSNPVDNGNNSDNTNNTGNSSSTGATTWATWVSYSVGDVVTYNGVNYVCLLTHVSYSDTWNPVDAPTLWARL